MNDTMSVTTDLSGNAVGAISDVLRQDSHAELVSPKDMLLELAEDNRHLMRYLRASHRVCERHDDVATASLIEVWIDETERRVWFLAETQREL